MSSLPFVIVALSMAAVAGALILGLVSFMREGAEHRARSNRLMQWRVGLQLLAVALMAGFVLLGAT